MCLRYDPHGAAPPATTLTPLSDHGMRAFVRDAVWQGSGSAMLFARLGELPGATAQFEQLDSHDGLATAVFARSVAGVPQVSLNGTERDLTPAEFAAVLAAHVGVRPGAELRLVVLDTLRAADDTWREWVRRAAATTRRTIHFAGPDTSVLIPEGRPRRRPGSRHRDPRDYRLVPAPGAKPADPTAPLWRSVAPDGGDRPRAFIDEHGRLVPARSDDHDS
jgi:hypothetical protein